MRTLEEQKIINLSCKYFPRTEASLVELCKDPEVYLGDINTSLITDMSDLFFCFKREDFSGIQTWDVSRVRDMSFMFCGCGNFNEDLSDWNVSNVKNMYGMFDSCKAFTRDISSWFIYNKPWTQNMFYNTDRHEKSDDDFKIEFYDRYGDLNF